MSAEMPGSRVHLLESGKNFDRKLHNKIPELIGHTQRSVRFDPRNPEQWTKLFHSSIVPDPKPIKLPVSHVNILFAPCDRF